MQVLAPPEKQVLIADQTVSRPLLQKWDEAALEVGLALLTSRRVFGKSTAQS